MEKLNNKIKKNRGMTYVELIVVLSIFSVMTSIVLFDYGKFQENVDIKILANDIAIKVVEAQKSSISGQWNSNALLNWKPSYGIHFDISNNKSFKYFADLNNNYFYEDSGCTGECLDQITITKNNSISKLEVVGTGCPSTVDNLNIVFKRPDPGAIISSNPILSCTISYAQITISSPKSLAAKIKIYPSGRIQIN
jgi:prepilin-type N-terminal cleavage/methylation domain-containing protein